MSDIAAAFAINAAWQAFALAIAGMLLARSLPSRQRFHLLALTLAACAIAPALTLLVPRPIAAISDAVTLPERGFATIAAIYCVGLAFFAFRFARAAGRAWTIVAASTPHAQRLRVSPAIETPVTIGRTVIVPPFVLANARLLDAALAHEHAHVRRHDYFVHLALELFALPLYFHPLVHLLRRELAVAREAACDEEAAARYGRNEYAAALVEIASLTTQRRIAAMSMATTSIERRVGTLLRPPRFATRRAFAQIVIVVAIAAACTRFDAAPTGANALHGSWAMVLEDTDLSEVEARKYDAFTQTIRQEPSRVSVRQQRTRKGRTQVVAWSVITDGIERPLVNERGARGSARWRDGQLVMRFRGPGARRENTTAVVRNGRLLIDGATERGRYHAEFKRIDR